MWTTMSPRHHRSPTSLFSPTKLSARNEKRKPHASHSFVPIGGVKIGGCKMIRHFRLSGRNRMLVAEKTQSCIIWSPQRKPVGKQRIWMSIASPYRERILVDFPELLSRQSRGSQAGTEDRHDAFSTKDGSPSRNKGLAQSQGSRHSPVAAIHFQDLPPTHAPRQEGVQAQGSAHPRCQFG
jgi:hypothetical protein